MEGSYYTVTYGSKEYKVQTNIVNSFFYWQVYNDVTEVVKVELDDNKGNIRQPRLIPSRGQVHNGQMKIMIDAILTIDEIPVKENLKVLIVGSSHEPMAVPRSSYEPLFFMIKNSIFDLYDFVEEEGESIINTNKIRRFRKLYDYSDLEKYDVYLDDSWSDGKTVFDSKMYNSSSRKIPRYYSIKSFEELPLFNIYHQVSSTAVGEKRLVSRTMIPSYRENLRLGKCCFCMELQFFLQCEYSDEVYKSIHRQHKSNNCVPRNWYREINNYMQLKNKITPNWTIVSERDYVITAETFVIKTEKYPLRTIMFSQIKQLLNVEMREEHLSLVAVVVDREELCTQHLLSARSLYMWDGKYLYQHLTYSTIPTEAVVEYVKESVQSVRTQIADHKKKEHSLRMMMNLREANTVPDIQEIQLEEPISPQQLSIDRGKMIKNRAIQEWRVKDPMSDPFGY